MTALGSATMATPSGLSPLTAVGYDSPDYGVLLDGDVAISAAGGEGGFDVPEVGIIWPNGVNVNT